MVSIFFRMEIFVYSNVEQIGKVLKQTAICKISFLIPKNCDVFLDSPVGNIRAFNGGNYESKHYCCIAPIINKNNLALAALGCCCFSKLSFYTLLSFAVLLSFTTLFKVYIKIIALSKFL